MCISLCTTVTYNTAQSSSDYLPSYSPDKHQSSDAVYFEINTYLLTTGEEGMEKYGCFSTALMVD